MTKRMFKNVKKSRFLVNITKIIGKFNFRSEMKYVSKHIASLKFSDDSRHCKDHGPESKVCTQFTSDVEKVYFCSKLSKKPIFAKQCRKCQFLVKNLRKSKFGKNFEIKLTYDEYCEKVKYGSNSKKLRNVDFWPKMCKS